MQDRRWFLSGFAAGGLLLWIRAGFTAPGLPDASLASASREFMYAVFMHPLLVLMALVTIHFALASISLGRDSARSGESLYPKELLALPVRPAALVAWPMGLGALVSGALGAVAWLVYLRSNGNVPPALLPVLAVMFCAMNQTLRWQPFRSNQARSNVHLTMIAVGGLVVARGAILDWIVAGALSTLPIFYMVAVDGVVRARDGWTPIDRAPRRLIGQVARAMFRGGRFQTRLITPLLRSPLEARRWFERLQHGGAYPSAIVGVGGILTIGLVLFSSRMIKEDVYAFVIAYLYLVHLLALVGSSSDTTLDPARRRLEQEDLFARPIRDEEILRTRLALVARSVCIGWASMLAITACWGFLPVSDPDRGGSVLLGKALLTEVGRNSGLGLRTWEGIGKWVLVGLIKLGAGMHLTWRLLLHDLAADLGGSRIRNLYRFGGIPCLCAGFAILWVCPIVGITGSRGVYSTALFACAILGVMGKLIAAIIGVRRSVKAGRGCPGLPAIAVGSLLLVLSSVLNPLLSSKGLTATQAAASMILLFWVTPLNRILWTGEALERNRHG